MRWLSFCIYLLIFIAKENLALEIVDFIAPTTLKNNSVPLLVLDCPYLLSKGEERGLVVKWFYGSIPFPIYQWIPGNKPQDLIFFKGLTDTSYEASKSYVAKHRALAIMNPITQYSGKYTCTVSNFDTEDSMSKDILIFSPASSIQITYSRPKENILLVTCHADGLFPEPEIHLYRGIKSSERSKVEALSKSKLKHPNSSYNATIHYKLYDNELEEEELFSCVVALPGTDYVAQEELLFYRDPFFNRTGKISLHIYLIYLVCIKSLLLLVYYQDS